jgi:hypothetical protein
MATESLALVLASDRNGFHGRELQKPKDRKVKPTTVVLQRGSPVVLVPAPGDNGQPVEAEWKRLGIWLLAGKLVVRLDPKPGKEVPEHELTVDLADCADPLALQTIYLYKEQAFAWTGICRPTIPSSANGSAAVVHLLLDTRVQVREAAQPTPPAATKTPAAAAAAKTKVPAAAAKPGNRPKKTTPWWQFWKRS